MKSSSKGHSPVEDVKTSQLQPETPLEASTQVSKTNLENKVVTLEACGSNNEDPVNDSDESTKKLKSNSNSLKIEHNQNFKKESSNSKNQVDPSKNNAVTDVDVKMTEKEKNICSKSENEKSKTVNDNSSNSKTINKLKNHHVFSEMKESKKIEKSLSVTDFQTNNLDIHLLTSTSVCSQVDTPVSSLANSFQNTKIQEVNNSSTKSSMSFEEDLQSCKIKSSETSPCSLTYTESTASSVYNTTSSFTAEVKILSHVIATPAPISSASNNNLSNSDSESFKVQHKIPHLANRHGRSGSKDSNKVEEDNKARRKRKSVNENDTLLSKDSSIGFLDAKVLKDIGKKKRISGKFNKNNKIETSDVSKENSALLSQNSKVNNMDNVNQKNEEISNLNDIGKEKKTVLQNKYKKADEKLVVLETIVTAKNEKAENQTMTNVFKDSKLKSPKLFDTQLSEKMKTTVIASSASKDEVTKPQNEQGTTTYANKDKQQIVEPYQQYYYNQMNSLTGQPQTVMYDENNNNLLVGSNSYDQNTISNSENEENSKLASLNDPKLLQTLQQQQQLYQQYLVQQQFLKDQEENKESNLKSLNHEPIKMLEQPYFQVYNSQHEKSQHSEQQKKQKFHNDDTDKAQNFQELKPIDPHQFKGYDTSQLSEQEQANLQQTYLLQNFLQQPQQFQHQAQHYHQPIQQYEDEREIRNQQKKMAVDEIYAQQQQLLQQHHHQQIQKDLHDKIISQQTKEQSNLSTTMQQSVTSQDPIGQNNIIGTSLSIVNPPASYNNFLQTILLNQLSQGNGDKSSSNMNFSSSFANSISTITIPGNLFINKNKNDNEIDEKIDKNSNEAKVCAIFVCI